MPTVAATHIAATLANSPVAPTLADALADKETEAAPEAEADEEAEADAEADCANSSASPSDMPEFSASADEVAEEEISGVLNVSAALFSVSATKYFSAGKY